jgi:hypothetical protein
MNIEIEIQDNKIQNLSSSAHLQIKKVTQGYLEEVLDEANRIEESRRTSVDSPEITASIIDDAAHYAKTHGIRKKKPKKLIWLQIVAFIGSIFTGGLFEVDKFKTLGYILLFLAVFLIAVVSSVYLIFKDNQND